MFTWIKDCVNAWKGQKNLNDFVIEDPLEGLVNEWVGGKGSWKTRSSNRKFPGEWEWAKDFEKFVWVMSADWEMSRSAAESRTFPIVPYFAFLHIFIQFLSFMKLSRSVPKKKKKKKIPVKGGREVLGFVRWLFRMVFFGVIGLIPECLTWFLRKKNHIPQLEMAIYRMPNFKMARNHIRNLKTARSRNREPNINLGEAANRKPITPTPLSASADHSCPRGMLESL